MRGLKMKSGFSSTEIFRKYLWYLLRERKFDEDAVSDLAALRTALGMTDDEARIPLGNSYSLGTGGLGSLQSHLLAGAPE